MCCLQLTDLLTTAKEFSCPKLSACVDCVVHLAEYLREHVNIVWRHCPHAASIERSGGAPLLSRLGKALLHAPPDA